MFCKACGFQMEDGDRFCPACGAKNIPDAPAAPMDEYAPVDSGAAASANLPEEDFRTVIVDGGIGAHEEPDIPTMIVDTGIPDEEPDIPTMILDGGVPEEEPDVHTVVLDGYGIGADQEDDSHTVVMDGYGIAPQPEPFPPAAPCGYPTQEYSQNSFPQPQEEPPRPTNYGDSFSQQPEKRFGDSGYRDQSQSKYKPYEKTTAGKRIASIVLCLLTMLFSSTALFIGTARIAVTEDKVRKAYQKGTLADLVVMTEKGKQKFSQILMDSMVDAKTNEPIPVDQSAVEKFLRTQRVNNFVENLTVDFTQFFVFGKTPTLLNDEEIVKFLKSVSADINDQINYSMSDQDIENIGKRIRGGDLSFLSIDENGGYFKERYHVHPNVLSYGFSIPALAISGVLALFCMIMVFVINRRNPPAGFSFNGATLIIFGAVNALSSVGLLVLSYLWNVFFLSEMMRGVAVVCGAISLCIIVVGIVFEIIKVALRNRIK